MQRVAGVKHEGRAPEESACAPQEGDKLPAALPGSSDYAWLGSGVMPAARVLVVEDSPAQAEWLKQTLAHQGYRVIVARDGRGALRHVMSDAPDLVLLDVMLPDMDGLEVLRVIKMRSAEQFVPVILISAKADLESRVTGLRVGADDFLAKPFAEAEIQARAASMLRIKSLQDQLREAKALLERLAVADGLTGLYNRRTFEERLRDEFRRSQRYGDPVSLMILDLDHFKLLNDEYGHPFGDRVLRGTAEIISSTLRDPDICARYGGEEFAIILPKTNLEGALALGERILTQLRDKTYSAPGHTPVATGCADVRVTASAGVAFHPSPGITTPELLIDCADEALYRAKRDGRDRVRPHTQAPKGSDVSSPVQSSKPTG
jgi:diguanylate cyclase (GGDEF)-like protein